MLSMSNHKLMYALVAIYNELKQQGVKHVAFGSMFHRHHRQYNKMAKRLNKILFKIHPEKVWHHGNELIGTINIDKKDKTHLKRSMEPELASSIADALCCLACI